MNDKAVFEKQSVKPVLFPAAIISIFLYAVSFFFVFFLWNIGIFIALSAYLILYLIVLIVCVFLYSKKASHLTVMTTEYFMGINRDLSTRRTGLSIIDVVGLIIALGLFVLFVFNPLLNFLLPFFMLLSIYFIMALAVGRSADWDVTTGRTTLSNQN